mgnify:FL=1|jgi:hypothetical protein
MHHLNPILHRLAALLWVVGSALSASGQCQGEVFMDHGGAACGYGLMKGQTFTVPSDGNLTSIQLTVCSGTESQLAIRQYNGDGSDWAEGSSIGTADATFPAVGSVAECYVSVHGFQYYIERTFTFSDLGLQAGTPYVMHLVQGAAATGCSVGYPDGQAFNGSGPQVGTDLVFELTHCPDPTLVFGCTSPSACNYDPAATSEDGSCLLLDCLGHCGGNAYLDPDCGCLASEAEAGSCLGCTDIEACNYDATATVEDGSCLPTDCHGDCGGSAVVTDCGCIGGQTGIPANACIDGCTTEVIASDSTGCSPGLMEGQSFTATTTGHIKQIWLKVCCASDAQVTLRNQAATDACAPPAWNSGEVIGVSNLVSASCTGLANCLTGGGVDGYAWTIFEVNNLPVQDGQGYIIELNQGVALSSCVADYAGGTAFDAAGAEPSRDLVMEVHTCAADLVFGCTDPAACSGYHASATHNDGSCVYADCHGTCGGTAVIDANCGCIGGETGIRTEQCIDGTIQEALAHDDATPCSATLSGQTFTMSADGFLTLAAFNLLVSSGQSVELHREDGPLAGTLLGTANRSAEGTPCLAGTYDWQSLDFEGIPMEAGRQYRLSFTTGNARRICSTNYADGHGITSSGAPSTEDLAFRIVHRIPNPGELFWGCTDPSFCNYEPAATHDNGSCAPIDCNGDCAGGATTIAGCGCVGGNTGIDPASCYGCMEPTACNYAPGAMIDDGSCGVYDCHGTCGGTAVNDPTCGCIGGETGIDSDLCHTAQCQGTTTTSTYTAAFDMNYIGFNNSGQTFTAAETTFLSAVRLRQLDAPTNALTVELRTADGADVHSGTLLTAGSATLWDDTPGEGGDILVQLDVPAALQSGATYALRLVGGDWKAIGPNLNLIDGGGAFSGLDMSAGTSDLYFELVTCAELIGCTVSTACNFDATATLDDGSCTYPTAGEDCDGAPCAADADNDGICAAVDLDDNDPFVCQDSDNDGCDDCLSGTYDPANDGEDADGDGRCDSSDLCTDLTADNFADPANGACQGTCDTAPVFEALETTQSASGLNMPNGRISLTLSTGNFPFTPAAAFEATTVELTGINGSADYTFSLDTDTVSVLPGFYSVMVYNEEGCPGVSSAPGGSAFGQPPVERRAIVGYLQCCGGVCGVYDRDTDGICDNEDNCTDRTAPNFDDPANGPCQ